MIESQLLDVAASAAPIRPPISACEDDDGRPNHQVIRFQVMPPSRAHRISCEPTSTTPASIRPEAIVFATAVPASRSEEHTSELQSRENLVCRLLLEKKREELL